MNAELREEFRDLARVAAGGALVGGAFVAEVALGCATPIVAKMLGASELVCVGATFGVAIPFAPASMWAAYKIGRHFKLPPMSI